MFREIIPTIWCDYKVIDKVQEDSSGTTYKVSKTEGTKQIFRIVRVISIPHNIEEINILRSNGKTDSEIKEFYEAISRNTVNALNRNISASSMENLASAREVKPIPRSDIGFDIFVLEDLLKPLTLHCKTTILKEKDVAILGGDICSAISECHKNGIFHGSISPETIYLSPSKKYKLGNIGVAQREYFSPVNTIFASPELLMQGICNEKSDIYSLGLVLYTLLGGQMPYTVNTPHEEIISKKSSSEGFSLPKCLNEKLSSVIYRSIATDPSERFSSADEFGIALLGAVGVNASAKAITGDGIHPIYMGGKAVYKSDSISPKVTAKHDISAKHSPDSASTPDSSTVFTPQADNPDLIQPTQEESNNEARSPKMGIIIGVVTALAVIAALVIIILAAKGGENNSSEAPSGEISDVSSTPSDTASVDSSSSTASEESITSSEEASETASSEDTSENASSEDTSKEASENA